MCQDYTAGGTRVKSARPGHYNNSVWDDGGLNQDGIREEDEDGWVLDLSFLF